MDAQARERNWRAHLGLDRIGFPHRIVNHAVLSEIDGHFSRNEDPGQLLPRLLDVGCGSGFLLDLMLRRGWDARGIDPFPRGAAVGGKLRGRVVQGSVEALRPNSFDAVAAVEVLEHVPDYVGLLRAMVEVLKPGGLLVVTVPNDWPFRPVSLPNGSLEPAFGHLWRFRQDDLQADLAQVGKDARVRPLYSARLDRRLMAPARALPPRLVLRLSAALVARHADGAWLLGRVNRPNEPGTAAVASPPQPAARHFRDDPQFSPG